MRRRLLGRIFELSGQLTDTSGSGALMRPLLGEVPALYGATAGPCFGLRRKALRDEGRFLMRCWVRDVAEPVGDLGIYVGTFGWA